MTAESFRPDFVHKKTSAKDLEGYYGSRVSVTEGTTPQSRSRLVESPSAGNVHRNSVKEYKPHNTNHEPYSSAHRQRHPDEPSDLLQLKKHQQNMLSDRQKRKRNTKKPSDS